jgi:hypothetical protein
MPLPIRTYEELGSVPHLRFALLIQDDRVMIERDGYRENWFTIPYEGADALQYEHVWHEILLAQQGLRDLATAMEEIKRRFSANVQKPENLKPPPGWTEP